MSVHGTASDGGSPRHQLQLFGDTRPKPKPPQPPANASATSQAAAAEIADVSPNLRGRVYQAICQATSGLTRHEITERTGIPLPTVCPRIGELKRLGLIVERGTRPSPSGRAAGILYAIGKEPDLVGNHS